MRFLSKTTFSQLIILLSVVFLVQACGDDPTRTSRELDFSTVPEPFDTSQADTSYTKEGGVEIHVIEKGKGSFEVVPRDQIRLFITGRTSEGEIFRSTYANGNTRSAGISNLKPVVFREQNPQIEGLRRGLLGMKEGEKRVIIVPSSLGYNNSNPGVNGFDLRDESLRYDIELVSIL